MKESYALCLSLLRKELVPALGCTEPGAIAYAAAKARSVLGRFPDRMTVACSGNIIKNVKSVKVPAAEGQRGIEAAALLGMLGGDPDKALEIFSGVTPEHRKRLSELQGTGFCTRTQLKDGVPLHIVVREEAGGDWAEVEIRDHHTHIVRIERSGETLLDCRDEAPRAEADTDARLTFAVIDDFARGVPLAEIAPLMRMQRDCNAAVAREGLGGDYGARVGKTLLACGAGDARTLAKAWAAAGSDARMSGCELPVIINSGSGNQGMAVSLPVIEYAAFYNAPEETLLRALALANLTAIYQKQELGALSAFCGAVCAATGAGAGIAFLMGGDQTVIANTVINTLANVGGIVCDGAKPSCAAKIASAVDAAITGYEMAKNGNVFLAGDGLVKVGPDETVHAMMTMAADGMRQTEDVILSIMEQDC